MKNEVVEVIENLNAVELLLGFDTNKLETPKKVHKMFCKKLNKVIPFELEAITPERATKIQQDSLKFNTENESTSFEIDMYMSKLRTLVAGCKMFKNMDIVRHFGCATPHQLIETILVNGEITELNDEINKLSSVKKIEDKEIKN